MANYDIYWSDEAEKDLDNIFDFYFEKSPSTAHKIINRLIESAEALVFSEQFQLDGYKTGCRRIVIGHHKVLYITEENTVYIIRIFDSRQDPAKA